MNTNNVVKLPEQPTPPMMLSQAIAAGAGIDTIKGLLEAQEKWEAMQAKRAFNNAIAEFKANAPTILKNVSVGFESQRTGGKVGYKHEDLAEMLAIVDPALAAHGLWVRWKVNTASGKVKVTCVVGHKDGHTESDAELEASADTSGNKNAIQAIGSTVTYLQRYTMRSALGLAAARDDDGKAAGNGGSAGVLSDDQVAEINAAILKVPGFNVERFLKLAGAPSVSDIAATKFESAMGLIRRQQAKKEGKK
jgi:hypothetical protein